METSEGDEGGKKRFFSPQAGKLNRFVAVLMVRVPFLTTCVVCCDQGFGTFKDE